jgi:hypothetical protein
MMEKREKAIEKEMANLEKLKKQYSGQLQIKEQYVSTHLVEFHKPFTWQTNVGDMFRNKLITLAPAPNGIGKTTEVVCLVYSWMVGYEPWSPVEADYPGAVKKKGKFYKSSSLGILPPVRGRLTGNDWSHHLGQTVVRELKKWFPMDEFETKNNTQGVTWFWTHKKTGSTLELMTHDQKIDLFESWRGHFWVADEPPPYNIFRAMSGRGLSDFGGKILIPATPLTQAWMLDELVLKNRSDVGVMKDLMAYDNEIIFNHDDEILTDMGLTGKRTKYWREMDGQKKTFFDMLARRELYIGDDGANSGPPDDRGEGAEKYLRENTDESKHDLIMKLRFLKKCKDTDSEEKASRWFGIFKKLVGVVVKEFNKSKHILPAGDGKVPPNWIVSFQIDWHLGKPHAIAFFACSERNVHYYIDEVWENLTAEKVAALIIDRKRVKGWNITYGEIDPLSKGDDKYMKNRDAESVASFGIIEELLANEGIELGVASKDKTSGFSNIKAWLSGPNGLPQFYVLDNVQSVADDMYGLVYEVQRLCYDEHGKIEKVNDHFMECWYRYTLMKIEYREPRIPVLQSVGGGEGSWLGA